MRYVIPFVLAVAMVGPILTAHAQALPALGTRVRVTTSRIPRDRTAGVYERRIGDSVVVAGQQISLASIRLFEVSEGRKSNLLAGMGIGLLAGGGFGAILLTRYCPGPSDGYSGLRCAVEGGAFFGAIGLTAGGLLGAFTRHEKWHRIALDAPHLTLQPGPGQQVRLGFKVPF